ncbi:MAG: flagellar basal-body rod protein FlgG [Rhizobiales bacterium]|nr:flagellar basal-body rod protein FlgG [Hyphomicrobiales bacterium]
MQALHTAATGMRAQEQNVQTVANNISNIRTTGYKKQRAEFQDLLYQDLRRVGSTSSNSGTVVPTGIQIGSGVKFAATSRVLTQGSLEQTQQPLNAAIRGDGYFEIELPDGRTAYTRDGSFERNQNGEIVTLDGYQVAGGITIPQNARSITISNDGEVEVVTGNDQTPTNVGQIELINFVNPGGLEAIGDNLFLETAASGAPQTGTAGEDGLGTILQGFLEGSNVEAVAEISDLISAQRAYELNSRVISAADEMMQSAGQILR